LGGIVGNSIIFHGNGGSGTVPESIRFKKGEEIILPDGSGLSFGDAIFAGWILNADDGSQIFYEAGSVFSTSHRVYLHAKWNLDIADLNSAKGLANKLVWLQNNAQSNGSYILELDADEQIGPQLLYYHGKEKITITLTGGSVNRTVTYCAPAERSLFLIGQEVTLVLENNITLQGSEETRALVEINGTLIMNAGSTIKENRQRRFFGNAHDGNGVWVSWLGVFTMNGGTISNNTKGVWNNGTFNMNGGNISNNSIGVQIYFDGRFILRNGTISENRSFGVIVYERGTFGNYGGSITRNGDSSLGAASPGKYGGVLLQKGSRFISQGGNISGNLPTNIVYEQ
jgi:hypothetical protein